MRDWALLWVISVGFELMELTFQHMLPNFNECWWDSWILDVAVCNFAGMWGGMKACPKAPSWLQTRVDLCAPQEMLPQVAHGRIRRGRPPVHDVTSTYLANNAVCGTCQPATETILLLSCVACGLQTHQPR